MRRIPSSRRSAHNPTGSNGRKTTARSSAIGEMTDMRWISSAGPCQYGTSKTRTSPPTSAAELPGALGVRAQRPPDAEQVRAEPERVAALDRAGRLDPADGRDPGRARPGLDGVRFGRAIGLARAKRDRAPIGHEQRIERVHEVGRLELDVEDMDPRTEPGQRLDERIVLALRDLEVDRVQEAVRRDRRRRARRPRRAA